MIAEASGYPARQRERFGAAEALHEDRLRADQLADQTERYAGARTIAEHHLRPIPQADEERLNQADRGGDDRGQVALADLSRPGDSRDLARTELVLAQLLLAMVVTVGDDEQRLVLVHQIDRADQLQHFGRVPAGAEHDQ